MKYDFLMNISSALFFICYIPELYANWKNQNANLYNMPEKVIMLAGSCFAFSFALMNGDIALISNYGPIMTLDLIALIMRLYYVIKNRQDVLAAAAAAPPPQV